MAGVVAWNMCYDGRSGSLEHVFRVARVVGLEHVFRVARVVAWNMC